MELNHVTVPALDIPASVAFYRALGLRPIVLSAHYARFVFPEGDSTFSVHLAEPPLPPSATVVYFEDRDLDATVGRLQAAGLAFTQLPRDERWLWREARLHDPAGNVVCLYRAGDMRRDPPWKVGG